MYNKFSPFGNRRQVNLPFILEHGYRSLKEGGREKARRNKKKGKSSLCGSTIKIHTHFTKLLLAFEMKKKHFSLPPLASRVLPHTAGHKSPFRLRPASAQAQAQDGNTFEVSSSACCDFFLQDAFLL